MKSYGPNYTKFKLFDIFFFYNNFYWQRVDAILQDISEA